MRVGINALFLQKPTTGMGQHLLHLLEGLDSIDDKDQQYVLLAPRFRRAYTVQAPQLSDRFREVEAVSQLARLGENVEQVWWEQAGIVRAIHAENAQPVEFGQLLFELELADGRPPVL